MVFYCGPFDRFCVVFGRNRPLLTRTSSESCVLTIPLYMGLFWGGIWALRWKYGRTRYGEATANAEETDMMWWSLLGAAISEILAVVIHPE
jgi:hypothetical protein